MQTHHIGEISAWHLKLLVCYRGWCIATPKHRMRTLIRPHALPEGYAQILMIRILTCYDNFFTISCILF
jgi:hypothetical protein